MLRRCGSAGKPIPRPRDVDLHSISLFSGVGMLDEGLRAGLSHLGISHRTVCHVEREAHAAAVLAARMEEGSLDAAPIWTDVCTFDAAAWRGRVDCVVAGFPCQDLSVAGRRAGLDGKRSGLFFEVVRIAADSGAQLLFLENVAGIATATATVVDAEEGELDERAASRVVGELADLGWDAEWLTLSASDVGASHGRARWFCLAWRRVDDTQRLELIGQRVHAGQGLSGSRAADPGGPVAELGDAGHGTPGQAGGTAHQGGGGLLESSDPSRVLEQPTRLGRQERRPESAREQGRPNVAVDGSPMADTGCRDVRRVEQQPVSRRSSQASDHDGSPAVADTSRRRQPLAAISRGGA